MHILTSSNRVTLCSVQQITVNQNVVSVGIKLIKFLLKSKSKFQKKSKNKTLFHFLSPLSPILSIKNYQKRLIKKS